MRSSGGNAGRGGIAVLGAKVFFIASGFVQQLWLPRVIGLAGYGALSRVLAFSNVVTNVMVSSSIQGASRAIAKEPLAEAATLRRVLTVHSAIAVALGAGFAILAPAIAEFQKAPHIVAPMMVMAAVVLLYGLYAPLVGILNGRTLFARQAALDILSATLRTGSMVALGYALTVRGLPGVVGATSGAALAALLVLPIAGAWATRGLSSGQSTLTPRAYLASWAPLALAQLLAGVLMQIDLTLLGRFLSQGAIHQGLNAAAKESDEWVAVYRACQLFAFLPYQLMVSITQVLFPLVARANALGDSAAVRHYVERGSRLALIAGGLMTGVIAALPHPFLALTYGAVVADRGADTLRILAIGQGAFALYSVATTILSGLGHERSAATISGGATVAVGAGCVLFASRAGFGAPSLHATAIATSVAMFLALVTASMLVKRRTDARLPFMTVIRVIVSGGLIVVGGTMVPKLPILMAPVLAIAVAGVYLALLIVFREVTRGDAAMVIGMVRRRTGAVRSN